jgi:hypothetical protein
MSEQLWLRKHPSTNRWRLELGRLLTGERESALQRIGGAAAYVQRYIFDSDDPVRSDIAFRNALEEFVGGAWDPARTAEYGFYFTDVLLELIINFRPPSAFTRILDYLLVTDGRLAPKNWTKEDIEGIDSAAMTVLRDRYRLAPPASERDLTFEKYERLLNSLLQVPGKESYALRHLLELGLITPDNRLGLITPDNRLVQELVGKPGVVGAVINYFFSTERRDLLKTGSGAILGCCLRLDASADSPADRHRYYEEFRTALRGCGANLVQSDSPLILLANGSRIQVMLPPGDEHLYHETREEESRQLGSARWDIIDGDWAEIENETI